MSLLKPATAGGYLKAGFLGFAGGGKTFTATELALGTRKLFGLPGPIAMFDTEKGSDDIKDLIQRETGQELLVAKSRSLADLMAVTHECEKANVAVLIVDSITHVWREVCDSYLKQKIEIQRKQNRKYISDKLEFQDWSRIKSQWAAWPDWFLNAAMHVIVCGRAGYEYDMEANDDGRKELVKTGIKMKVEGEFGFEPALVVEMQRDFVTDKKGQLTDSRAMINRAIVLKDRKNVIDGRMCDDPKFEFFKPHVELLRAGDHVAIVTENRTEFQLDGEGRDEWAREREQRKILSEKITAAIAAAGMDGQGKDEKRARFAVLEKYFGSTSWTEISERTPSVRLAQGLQRFNADNGLVDDDDIPANFGAKPAPKDETDADASAANAS